VYLLKVKKIKIDSPWQQALSRLKNSAAHLSSSSYSNTDPAKHSLHDQYTATTVPVGI